MTTISLPSRVSHINNELASGGSSGFFAHHGIWAPGVRAFRQLSFAAKAGIISLAFLLPMLGLTGWLVQAANQAAFEARKVATRQHVEVARGIAVWAQAQEAAGKLTREEAQTLAMREIATLRYDANEYFWINDMLPRMVMHPIKPELNGKDIGDLKDPNGFALFKACVDVVRRDGKGFVSYQWPKPGSDRPVDKISYVTGLEPWGWVIGSGIYVGDLHEATVHQLALVGTVVACSMAIASYLFLSFYRVMDGGLKETRRHMRAMTEGDLTTSPHPWGRDEAAQLMLELRAMQDSLRGMVLRVRRASDEIVHSSGEIARGAMDLSSRTEHAAANLEESAASMEQITSTVKTGSDTTEEASRVARHNAEVAGEGGNAMHQVVLTMDGIRSSSAKIGEIIGTIDGIAFQTNILALNAAVEAARAGEQGRGFAVVASEVRQLAQRSGEAARQIKALISSSVDQVETGTGTVRQAGAKIDDIVSSSKRVDQLLGEVAHGAREQSLGIAQVGQAVQDLDRLTQQNAALVEQTASAAGAMRDQALALAEEVSRFRMPEGHTSGAQAPDSTPDQPFDFNLAIEAHRQWKVRLRKAIADRDKLDAAKICRDDQCPLGQWIHGPGGTRWATAPLFVSLLEKHADFHRAAGAVAENINAGRYIDAERLIGSGSTFADCSIQVSTLLTRAKREL